MRIDTNKMALIGDPDREGVRITPLFRDEREDVRLECWAPGASVAVQAPGGAELFILEGGFEERSDRLRVHSWLRVPMGETVSARAGPDGARVWIKTGHLRFVSPPATG